MTFFLGLTGSIGMGKSTTAEMFAALGCAVWDAAAAVHRLYAPGGAAGDPITARFPAAVSDQGISRAVLREIIAKDPDKLAALEAVTHPLLAADRQTFRHQASRDAVPVAVFDIPLLFENNLQVEMDAVAVVSVPPNVQRQRVLNRSGMTPSQLDLIMSRQMPDSDKRARANWVIPTATMEVARNKVRKIYNEITGNSDASDRSRYRNHRL